MKRPALPALLADLNRIGYDSLDGEGIDFYPFEEFLSVEETQSWYRAWTGNSEVDGSEYLVFGQDGTGGYAAFWTRRSAEDLLEQPIVFLGSEGETGVVANNFRDYLWLLAGGYGPYEATSYPIETRPPLRQFEAFAVRHAPDRRKSVQEVVARANAEFPTFSEDILTICR